MTHPKTGRLAALLAIALLAAPSVGAEPAGDSDEAVAPPPAELLGRFFVRDARLAEGAKLRLSFTLYAVVEEGTEAQFLRSLEHYRARARGAVITAVRMSRLRDFQEPGLEAFRRRVLLRLRRMVPMLHIDGLLVGEFEFFIEQG